MNGEVDEMRDSIADFYRDVVRIGEWLTNSEKQRIEFNDRVEYKVNNVYHRLQGPAIEYKADSSKNEYYIEGVKLDEKDFTTRATQIIRSIKINLID